MKKLVSFFFIMILILAGCGMSEGSNLQSFDSSELKAELENLTFQPQVPTKTPFEVTKSQFSQPPNQDNVVIIDFRSSGESVNHMGLMVVNGKNVNSSDMEFEEVEIGDIKGEYAVNDSEAMILKWTQDGISYDLTYFGKQSDKGITKEDLIETAESFE